MFGLVLAWGLESSAPPSLGIVVTASGGGPWARIQPVAETWATVPGRDALAFAAGAAMMALAALALRRRVRLARPVVLAPAQLPAIRTEPLGTAVFHFAGGAYEAIADGVIVSDADDRVVLVNRAFTTLTGFSTADVLGVRVGETGLGLGGTLLQAELTSRLGHETHVRAEVKRHCCDGRLLPTWLTISALCDDAGRITHYVRVLTDLVPLKAAQEQLERAAYRDALTGLPNRRMFTDRLDQALRRAKRSGRSVSVLYIDLNEFKAVNDNFGHEVGDRLLIGIAGRLASCLRECDCLCRLGGDEFTVLLEDAQTEADAAAVRDRMHDALVEPFVIDGNVIAGSASIGIAVHSAEGSDASALLRQADEAMYRVKRRGQVPQARPVLRAGAAALSTMA